MYKTKKIIPAVLAISLVAANLVMGLAPASAAPLTNTYLRTNRMTAGSQTSARVVFQTSASISGTTFTINMNGADSTTWTGSSGAVNATQTVSSAACATEASATALPGTLAASGNAGTGVITITGTTTLTASTKYCVDLTSTTALTLPTAGEYHPVISVGSDSTTVAVRTISSDQIVVNAVVPPTFNFVLSGTSDNFLANLTSGTVGITNGVTATVNTNAKTGWIAWAKDSNAGLTSAAAGKTITSTTPGTSATLANNVEGYTMGVTNIAQGSGVGTTNPDPAYDALTTAHGSGLDTNFRRIAFSNGTASNAIITLKERAAVSPLTPSASDYTDTITVIGAGNF